MNGRPCSSFITEAVYGELAHLCRWQMLQGLLYHSTYPALSEYKKSASRTAVLELNILSKLTHGHIEVEWLARAIAAYDVEYELYLRGLFTCC